MPNLHEQEEEEQERERKKERGRRKEKGERKTERKRREHSYDESCCTSQYLVHLRTLSQQQVLYIFKHLNRKVNP